MLIIIIIANQVTSTNDAKDNNVNVMRSDNILSGIISISSSMYYVYMHM